MPTRRNTSARMPTRIRRLHFQTLHSLRIVCIFIYLIAILSAMAIAADATNSLSLPAFTSTFAPLSLTPSQTIHSKTASTLGGRRHTGKTHEHSTAFTQKPHANGCYSNTSTGTSTGTSTSIAPLFLVPSQSINGSHHRYVSKSKHTHSSGLYGKSRTTNDASVDINVDANADADAESRTKNQQMNQNSTSKPNSKPTSKSKPKPHADRKKHPYKYYGNTPDVNWRAIPMEHLRSHPLYIPLPHPNTITHLNSLEDVRNFRQDSWQWDELHKGRCTTSQAAPALGLLEPNAARALGIPRSLQKGCMSAFYRLGQPALRNLEDMNRILATGGNEEELELESEDIWKEMNYGHVGNTDGIYPFPAKYMPCISNDDLNDRTEDAEKYLQNLSSPMRIRMSWGNCQEATAILTALNYFSKHDPDLRVKEVGMCGAGLDLNVTNTGQEPGLMVGASPDSVIEYSNGTLEVLEVKNHCPFVPTEWTSGSKDHKNKKMKLGDYRIRELPLQFSVPPAYIPQLMMEMLCCGDSCRSAIMVRQTATCGAVILRLHRDDQWITEMNYWLQRFMVEYVDGEVPPPPNFFWDCDEESDRYKKFIQRTKTLSEQVELVEYVRHNDIQRVLGKNGLRCPLFLDHLK